MTPIEILLAASQIIVLLATGVTAWRKYKPEKRQMDADALESTSTAASKSADMFNKAMDEIGELRKRQNTLDVRIDELKTALKRSNAERNAAFNWAARFIKQMQEINPMVVPVEYIPPPDTDMNIQLKKPDAKSGGA